MFNVTGGELVIIFLAALVILGPERLPEAARTVGKVMAQLRSVSQGFQKELQSALDETGEPFREMVRPRLTSLDGGAKPDATEKPRSATMFDANSPSRPEPEPDPGWSTPPRPTLPGEADPADAISRVDPPAAPEAVSAEVVSSEVVSAEVVSSDVVGADGEQAVRDASASAPPFVPGTGPVMPAAASGEDPGAQR